MGIWGIAQRMSNRLGIDSSSTQSILCDEDYHAWNAGLGFYTYWFYMSKYYEFLDSAILIWKGRPVSLLQSYHHAGVVLCCYLLYIARVIPAILMVGFNSWVHTWMYAYYAVTALGYKPAGKHWLTKMQIGQFIFGMASAISTGFGCGLWRGWEGFTIAFNVAYLLPLTSLFMDFSKKTYGKTSVVKTTPMVNKME